MTSVPMNYLELSHIFSQFFNRKSAVKYFLQTYFPRGKTCEIHQRLCIGVAGEFLGPFIFLSLKDHSTEPENQVSIVQ